MDLNNKLVRRNVTVGGHRTSLRLESEMWDGLTEVCRRENVSLHQLCSVLENGRSGFSRTSAVRAFLVGYFRNAATEEGHVRAGHGGPTEGVKDALESPLQAFKEQSRISA